MGADFCVFIAVRVLGGPFADMALIRYGLSTLLPYDMQDFIGRVDSFIFRFAIFAGD